jgi:alpha-1,3/alpha-1,6-mannosyltransferase
VLSYGFELLYWIDFALGGAERLVVDAALGLQKLGHSVDIYTSYHDPGHCFEETRDGEGILCHLVPCLTHNFTSKKKAV